jgi:hypothetical protein
MQRTGKEPVVASSRQYLGISVERLIRELRISETKRDETEAS